MNRIALEKLVTSVANSLRSDGEILTFSNDYRITYVELYFRDDANHTAHAELFHQGRDGDDGEGKHPNASMDEAADACVQLLKSLRDFQDIARKHNLHTISVALRRSTIKDEVTRYLYSAGGGQR